MSVVVNGRVPDELAVWVEAYARERGVSKSDLVVTALVSLREAAESGVVVTRERVRALRAAEARGVRPSRVDFARATAARSELFRGLQVPPSTRGIKPSKEKESR